MSERPFTAFFAYPGQPDELVTTINEAAKRITNSGKLSVLTWPDMGVFGTAIPDEVRNNIASAKVLVFDVTRPNLNVYYEAGYAIGLGKAIAPVVNKSFENALADVQRDGLFDNIGYRSYGNPPAK